MSRGNSHEFDNAAVAALAAEPVGRLVAASPARAGVFEQLGIDYCCGGKIPLADACKRKGLSLDEVAGKILAADRQGPSTGDPDWAQSSLKELIEHIVEAYHKPLRAELGRIAQHAEKVARVHGPNHPEMVEVLRVFIPFRDQLELHMQKEEMILFPGIVRMEVQGGAASFGCGGGIEHPIAVMTQEHDEAAEAMRAMRRLTNDYTAPADACNTFKVLLHLLAQMESEMHQHVHKENNILFPRAVEFAAAASACR